ncbi:hypothetical protein B0H67DRAFT_545436 [Lasiosphaeris hirsuta]|uniref:Uncharacterized protein n=1 Tax=Lasiosphaeris hirsuta TaxID=260670 RepID=A0AA39ZWI0_9PEZI|nr:hypothetical protein B0H67DRAFT_545436 [Lasiosphaeris hirsuta]
MPPPNTPEEGVPAAVSSPPARARRSARNASISSVAATIGSETQGICVGSVGDLSSRTRPCVLPINYQELRYESEVDKSLECPICRTPFSVPITTKPCGHTFCSVCLLRAHQMRPVCPIDRRPLDIDRDFCKARVIHDQLDRLRVKCPSQGCDYVCPRELLAVHYERYCEGTPVPCPDNSCDLWIARHDATPDKGCLHKYTPCQYCSKQVMKAALEEHYDRECSGNTVKCAECDVDVVQHRMESHVVNDCPSTVVSCKWSSYGCGKKAPRRDIWAHEKKPCVYQAIGRLVKDREEDRLIISELRARLSTVEGRLRMSEKEKTERKERKRRQASSNVDNTENTIPAFVPDLNLSNSPRAAASYNNGTWDSPEDYMLAQFERMETQMEDLRKNIHELDGLHSMRLLNDTMRLNEQIAELGSKVGVIGMHTTWLMNVQRQSRGQQRAVGGVGSPLGAFASSSGGSGATSGATAGGVSDTLRNAPDNEGGRYYSSNMPPRRNSDGRGENPPRL